MFCLCIGVMIILKKKYAKVLQCIIYFVTLQPETLEVLPL